MNILDDNLFKKDYEKLLKVYQSKNFVATEIHAKKLISKYPRKFVLFNLLGLVLSQQNKTKKAIQSYKQAIDIKPNFLEAQYNLAAALHRLKKFEDAVIHYKQVVKLKPELFEVYIPLGNILKFLGKIEESIKCFKKALHYQPDLMSAHISLGIALQENKNYEEAILHLKKSTLQGSKARILECLYALGKIDEYKKNLKEICKSDPKNIRAGTISTFASQQLNLDIVHPFCKKPFDFIYIKNTKNIINNFDLFLNSLRNEIDELESYWEESGKVTIKGFKTFGNIFDNKNEKIVFLNNLILDEINKYKYQYQKSKSVLISQWPKKFTLYGWSVKYLKCNQNLHIHPDGWISGCFYISMPKKLKGNEGAIKFSLQGFNYPIMNKKKGLTTTRHKPQPGDIVLFPSSLFHGTIPFSSEDERIVIAFDVRPQTEKIMNDDE